MQENVKKVLAEIEEIRKQKYQAEIDRQVQIIQSALMAFLEQKKKEYENLERATIRNQRPSEVKFSFKMDAEILPEVAQTIFENLGLKVCSSETQNIYGIFKV